MARVDAAFGAGGGDRRDCTCCISGALIWHSVEAKPYSGDVCLAVALLAVMTNSRWPEADRLWFASILAALGVWFSYGGALVFAGLMLVTIPRFAGQSRVGWGAWVRSGLLFVVSMAGLYWVSLRHQAQPHFYNYWRDRLFDPSEPWKLPAWLIEMVYELADYPYEPLGIVVLALVTAGGVGLYRGRGEDRRTLALLLAPIAVTLAAAMLRRYPFGGSRLTIFLAPSLFLLAGHGAYTLWQSQRRAQVMLARGVVALLAGYGVLAGTYHLLIPRHRGHIRPAVDYVESHREDGEPMYVLSGYEPALIYWDETDHPRPLNPDLIPQLQEPELWVIARFDDPREEARNRQSVERKDDAYDVAETFRTDGALAWRLARMPVSHSTAVR